MAEEIIINIPVSEVNQKIGALTDEVFELTTANKRLGKEIKAVTGTTKQDIEIKKKLNQQLQTNKDRIKSANAARGAAVKSITGEKSAFDKLNDSLKENTTAQNKSSNSIAGMGAGLSSVSPAMGGFVTKIGAMTKGAMAFIATPLGAVLAAIVVVLGAVKTAFTSSEKGQDKWNKIMSVGGAILGNLVDLLADFGEMVIEAFENPQKSIEAFASLIKENIINRFEGLAELLPQLGKAITLLFDGEFSKAGEVATNAVAKVTLGVEDMTGKIKEGVKATQDFIKEQAIEGAQAAKVADMRAKADKVERKLLVDRAEIENKIAELRLKAKKEDEFSAADRKAALLEANDLQDVLIDKETEALTLRRDAQILENTFSRTNKENLDKEAQAIAAVNSQNAKRANQARTLQRELNTVNAQVEADQKRISAAELKAIDDFNKAKESIIPVTIDVNNKLKEEAKKKYDDDLAALIEANSKLKAEDQLTISGINQYKIEAKKQLDATLDEIDNARAAQKQQEEFEKERIDLENNLAFAKEGGEIKQALLLEQLEAAKQAEIAAVDQTGADVTLIEKKYAAMQKAITDQTSDARLASLSSTLSQASSLFEEESSAYKATASAQALIDTYKSANSAYAAMAAIPPAPVFGVIAAGVAVAAGLKNVKKINSVKPKLKAENGLVVPGTSYTGDNINVAVNSGEEILTRKDRYSVASLLKNQPQQGFNYGALAQAMSNININASISEINDVNSRIEVLDNLSNY